MPGPGLGVQASAGGSSLLPSMLPAAVEASARLSFGYGTVAPLAVDTKDRMLHCELECPHARVGCGGGKVALRTDFLAAASSQKRNWNVPGLAQDFPGKMGSTSMSCHLSITPVRDAALQLQPDGVGHSALQSCPTPTRARLPKKVARALSQLSVEPLEDGDHAGQPFDVKWDSRPRRSAPRKGKDAPFNGYRMQETDSYLRNKASAPRGAESYGNVNRNADGAYKENPSSRGLADRQVKKVQPTSRAGLSPSAGSSSSKASDGVSRMGKEAPRPNPPSPKEDSNPQVSSTRGTVRESTSTSSIQLDAIGRLHQQLEGQSEGFLGISGHALSGEEAEAVRGKLREQRKKGLEAIREKLRSQGHGKSDDGDFFHGVDPETLVVDEYIVHKKVGVGRFIGMKYEMVEGKNKMAKYVYLQYADGKAKVRAKQAHRLLYRYNSPREIGRSPPLSKLSDTSLWEKRKMKGKMAIQKMVVNMMELYVYRLKQKRPPYPKIASAMAQFAEKFPYQATPDQLQAFKDVEKDLTEQETPMDRLICGDVGFGKTEVALRAIFQAVASGRQTMVMAPTTVLAKQHFAVIKERFATYPQVTVALLTRFQKEAEKKEVLARIQDGTLRVVVGTHSLLGNHVRYNNLGLLVVDEEQRFGVRQKEKITALKTTVDVLTLSATPIPRTLYLALSGFKDASLITTPPPERRPIVTHLVQYNLELVKKAISFELERGGQVFYVVPRVKDIDETRVELERIFPDETVAIAHGQQSAANLEDSMESFADGESKILLCTTIIESGLDIRDVNTIIIEDVHLFGLSQLYQLRGRVGRADREAHAYLLHPPKEMLSDEAIERLVAVEECCELGQGFQLAERDMAIRGIGSIFGEKQSGDVAKIGVDLYLEMLFEGLAKIDNQQLPRVEYEDVQLDLDANFHISGDYVPASLREKVMRDGEKAARDGVRSLMLFTNRLRDEYGKEPASTEVFLKSLYIRRIAADLGIHRIRARGKSILMETAMEEEAYETLANAMELDSMRSSLGFEAGVIELQGLIGLPVERQMERILACLVELRHGLPVFLKHV